MKVFTSSLLVLFTSVHSYANERLSYDSFIDQVRARNLSLKVESAKIDASHANAVGVMVPPPMAGLMRMTDQRGESANGLEVTQMIPFPTKLYHDREARKLEARSEDILSEITLSDVIGKAKLSYVNLWVSKQRQLALTDKKTVLEGHIKLSQAAVRSDSFLRIHLLKAESELDSLENEIIGMDQEILAREAILAEMINVDAADFHPDLDVPPVTELPKTSSQSVPLRLEVARLSLETLKARESEARASWFPDLNLRYKQMKDTAMMPGYTEVMVGFTLPFLYAWEPNAASQKASAQRMESEVRFAEEKRRITTEQTILLSQATSMKKQLENLEQKLLPRAQKRMRLVHNLAPRDMETLQDHRETMEAFPDLKLKALDLRVRYEEAVAEMQKFNRSPK